MDNVEQERVASPRPWRLDITQNILQIRDADRGLVLAFLSRFAENPAAEQNVANMELVVDAVNAFDRVTAKEKAVADEINALRLDNNRLRQTLKKLADMYMYHTVWRLSRDEQALVDEARAAIGEEAVNG